MMSVRRHSLQDAAPIKASSHVGLWFDKFLKEQKGETLEPYEIHIKQTSEIGFSPVYKSFFERWRATLQKMGAQIREADVVARLAAGLGGESVIENGLTFHHTYGVPIIPGSSLKGTARAYAAANLEGAWGVGEDDKGNKVYGDAFRTLFGGQALPSNENDSETDKERKKARIGIAVFHDALPVPGIFKFKIHNEVMTVHHKEYYQSGEQAPADWDSPTPIPFPSVSGRFLIAVHAAPQAEEWAASAMGILKMALEEYGVGGKTSSGFGRLDILKPEPSPGEQFVADFLQQLNDLPNN
ncbi:MAG: type III-B CRISPR module RAMP protein Cmr6, partial [Anaerolineae bacterium]